LVSPNVDKLTPIQAKRRAEFEMKFSHERRPAPTFVVTGTLCVPNDESRRGLETSRATIISSAGAVESDQIKYTEPQCGFT
jgi:hypothetical protein